MANEISRRNDWSLDPLFDEFSRRFFGDQTPRMFNRDDVLKTDIKDTKDAYVAKVDVPGIDKDEIKLNYQNSVLAISVTKHDFDDHADKDGNLLMSERRYGSMSRSYRLPNVDEKAIKAKYDAGVLTITLPKLTASEEDPHKISIE